MRDQGSQDIMVKLALTDANGVLPGQAEAIICEERSSKRGLTLMSIV